MAFNQPLRHELKFFINQAQYQLLSNALDHVLDRDPNGDENNEYHIRSLYFDTIYNTALYDKINGQQNRDTADRASSSPPAARAAGRSLLFFHYKLFLYGDCL